MKFFDQVQASFKSWSISVHVSTRYLPRRPLKVTIEGRLCSGAANLFVVEFRRCTHHVEELVKRVVETYTAI